MKILHRKLSEEESILIGERMKLVASGKPRMAEILELQCDPKDDPLAQRLFGELLRGNLIIVDNSQRKVTGSNSADFSGLELLPVDSADLEIHWINRERINEQGQLPLSDFVKLLPELDYEDFDVWHQALTDWVPLLEIKRMALGA